MYSSYLERNFLLWTRSFDKQLRPMDSDSFRSFQTPPSQKRSNSISIIYVSPECAEVLSKKQQAGSRRRKMPNLTSFGGVCDTPISVYKSGKTRVFEKTSLYLKFCKQMFEICFSRLLLCIRKKGFFVKPWASWHQGLHFK